MNQKQAFSLKVNGDEQQVSTRESDTLLYALRERLGLTGAKPGCENGDCDTCTILVDGKPIKSCLMLAVEAQGKSITTIEGLKNTPIQDAFVRLNAIQCGYCTPAMIINTYALIMEHPTADDETMKEWLNANLCRCMGYEEIRLAVKSVIDQNKSQCS